MSKEKSCGAVVYRKENNGYLFLLEKMKLGHISIPKGHVEANESEAETALREIKEETNLDVVVDTGFRRIIAYSPCNGCINEVIFFVAEAKENRKMEPQECEVKDLMWKSFQEAKELLTFDSDKQTLAAAYSYLKTILQ